jgi:hypothetical protein
MVVRSSWGPGPKASRADFVGIFVGFSSGAITKLLIYNALLQFCGGQGECQFSSLKHDLK